MSDQLAREGFGELNTNPHYRLFTSVSVGSIPRYYSVAEPGKVPGVHPLLFLDQTEAPKGRRKMFLRSPPPPPPPPSLSEGLDGSPPLSEGPDPPPLITYSFPLRSKCLFKLHQTVAQNLSGV